MVSIEYIFDLIRNKYLLRRASLVPHIKVWRDSFCAMDFTTLAIRITQFIASISMISIRCFGLRSIEQ
jgi:hypothetical protein